MSKIICDICGTAYPDTADQCPICGSAKQVDNKVASETVTESTDLPVKTATKGGHFSNANVRKRNKGKKIPVAAKKPTKAVKNERVDEPTGQTDDVMEIADVIDQTESNEKSNRGMLAVVWVLLIAVVLVLAYIVVQFILPMYGINLQGTAGKPGETTSAAVNTTVQPDTTPEDTSVACTGLTVESGDIVFDAAGRAWLLKVTAEPANTTDVIVFESADVNVATVSNDGRITAVGPGKTVITITCGGVT